MLVLSRKKNETIVINDDITIVVVKILKDKVYLGVKAPKEPTFHRRQCLQPSPEEIRKDSPPDSKPKKSEKKKRKKKGKRRPVIMSPKKKKAKR